MAWISESDASDEKRILKKTVMSKAFWVILPLYWLLESRQILPSESICKRGNFYQFMILARATCIYIIFSPYVR